MVATKYHRSLRTRFAAAVTDRRRSGDQEKTLHENRRTGAGLVSELPIAPRPLSSARFLLISWSPAIRDSCREPGTNQRGSANATYTPPGPPCGDLPPPAAMTTNWRPRDS